MNWICLTSTVNNSFGVLLWLSKINLSPLRYDLVLDFGGCQFTGSTFYLDVLKRISNYFDSKEESLIIPLSYGGSLKYIKKVESYAESIAPGRVITLKKYLPLNEYLGLISNCKSAIFAHERQQASDNIFLQLIYGARVFMSENSAAYVYLKGIGLKVYSLQKDIYLIMTPMGLQDIMENRKILSSLYSSSTLIKRVKDINTVFLESANRKFL